MIDAILITSALVVGGVLGYLVGRYHRELVDKIRTLEGQVREEPKPVVTMGAYDPPQPTTTHSDTAIGLVETKTPQLIEFEQQESIERQGLGA